MRLFAEQNAAVAFSPSHPFRTVKANKKITYDSEVLLIPQPTGIRGRKIRSARVHWIKSVIPTK